VVHADASMTVTEDIRVQATGREIKRGIVRDFPTTYRDRLGNTVRVGFKVEEVLRDGRPEPYRTQKAFNGVRIFIGQPDVFLTPGNYTYTIKYRVDGELGFFPRFDELYWNVTGNGWTLPIDHAEAQIELPAGAKILKSAAYTGLQGSRGRNFTVQAGDREIVFKTTKGLAPKEGLTVAVAWPKGVVQVPSTERATATSVVPVARFEYQSEGIRNFKSFIVVNRDASLTVTENITVQANGQEIKRGIVRDFPTTYRDRLGNTVRVGFKLEEVLRDGRSEPYHIQHVSNGVKIFIGTKKVFLRSGTYTYTIRYRVDREIGFFKDFDELYWNVTGNGWTFAIDHAEAHIELPAGAKILKYAAYTGYQGARGHNFTIQAGDRNIVFATTRRLAPREGLTVAVAWPKGVVHEPSGQERMGYFLRDNIAVAIGFIWLAVLLGFYLWAWVRVGRDPAGGAIIPLFSPPPGFSPAGTRFVSRMGYDDKAFAAAVVDMAVKGAVLIQEDGDDYTLVSREATKGALSRDELLVTGQLFRGGKSVKLENTNHTIIKSAIDALKKNLKMELEKVYFVTNSGYLGPGVAITLLGLGFVILTAADRAAATFGCLWLTIWTVACYFLAVTAYKRWQAARGGGLGKKLGALGTTLFCLPFFAGEIGGVVMLSTAVSIPAAATLAGMGFLNALFYHLLKAPTLSGRKIMDQIEGFKMYLSVAEKDRLNLLNPPEKTPALFEKYLPYALALDVENAWSEQFAEVLAKAGTEEQPYSPVWYSGRSWDNFQTSRFADSLGGAFAGAISSSSSPPGSSSGSGGGGFSGGGGGGGGGSGW
jgi:uncharacterized membrane protein YgcG